MAGKLSNAESRERERTLTLRAKEAGASDLDVFALIARDRAARWAPILSAIIVPPELTDWAQAMTDRHGPKVKIWRNTMDWIGALVVARYGEAEYHWPERLDKEDIMRAHRWLYRNDAPEGTEYLVWKGGNS